MKLLLHICCAPCLLYPQRILTEGQHELLGFFYNPNIQPATEYSRRRETLAAHVGGSEMRVIWGEYHQDGFFSPGSMSKENRCGSCYRRRLETAARVAAENGCDGFTTTLLGSRFQRHDLIRQTGEAVSRARGIPFYYLDFRSGWQEEVDASKKAGLYRQNYCGCLAGREEQSPKKQSGQDRLSSAATEANSGGQQVGMDVSGNHRR